MWLAFRPHPSLPPLGGRDLNTRCRVHVALGEMCAKASELRLSAVLKNRDLDAAMTGCP